MKKILFTLISCASVSAFAAGGMANYEIINNSNQPISYYVQADEIGSNCGSTPTGSTVNFGSKANLYFNRSSGGGSDCHYDVYFVDQNQETIGFEHIVVGYDGGGGPDSAYFVSHDTPDISLAQWTATTDLFNNRENIDISITNNGSSGTQATNNGAPSPEPKQTGMLPW